MRGNCPWKLCQIAEIFVYVATFYLNLLLKIKRSWCFHISDTLFVFIDAQNTIKHNIWLLAIVEIFNTQFAEI